MSVKYRLIIFDGIYKWCKIIFFLILWPGVPGGLGNNKRVYQCDGLPYLCSENRVRI